MPEGAGSGNGAATSTFVPDEGSVEQLISFGFTRPQCVKALKSTGGSLERAADWLFSHPDDTGKITSGTKLSYSQLFYTRWGRLLIRYLGVTNNK